jgi:hypothetical protein
VSDKHIFIDEFAQPIHFPIAHQLGEAVDTRLELASR